MSFAYGPHLQDILFLAYYVVVFSFIRQTLTIHVLKPLARKWGIRKEGKLDRFGEQGYALIYFSFFGTFGLVRRLLATHDASNSRDTEYLRSSCLHFQLGGIRPNTTGKV